MKKIFSILILLSCLMSLSIFAASRESELFLNSEKLDTAIQEKKETLEINTLSEEQQKALIFLQALQKLGRDFCEAELKSLYTREKIIQNFLKKFLQAPINVAHAQVDTNTRGESEIVIVICSYNNAQWYKWNLDSVFAQKYTNYKVIYVDDCSTDGTYELVKEYLKEHDTGNRVTLVHNKERQRALANLYNSIHTCKDNAIVVILDGDDRLAYDYVLAHINTVYKDKNIWLTYGQFKEFPSGHLGFCRSMPDCVVRNNSFRSYPDTPSHLRTFYARLFKFIKKEDLLYEGDFFPMTYDLAMMFPMMEMARNGHFKFIPDILLEYNTANSINDHKISKELQTDCANIIRSKNRYEPIITPFKNLYEKIYHIKAGKLQKRIDKARNNNLYRTRGSEKRTK